jgi:hypothetical protein
MQTPYATRFVPLLLLFALACSDNPLGGTRAVRTNPTGVISPTGTLDENIVAILALLPKGLETAATTRWANIKSKYVAGLSDPSQMAVAKQMLFDLSSWVKMKAPDMDTPPNAESKTAAAARAVLYMSLYIFNGPPTTPPPYNPGADAVVGLVTPGAAATVVTPTLHAGVQFEAGSVDENTIIVVTQNLTPYGANCSGPLQTGLCQYPQFYTFDQFPHKALLKAAKFSVCHINGGTFRSPLRAEIHDRFRLAHTKPADPADYTPGSTIPTQPGENIEILPLTTQTFTICDDVEYTPEPPPIGVIGALTKMGRAFARLVTPKTAYAIDQGGGGVSRFFSPFNDVDPLGLPDRSVQSLTVTPACGDCAVHPGDHVTVSYVVKNIGTATAIGVPATIHLVPPPPIEGPPAAELGLSGASIPLLVPNDSVIAINIDATIPLDAPPGDYTVKMTVGIDILPEEPGNLDNNSRSVPLTISGEVIGMNSSSPTLFAAAFRNGLDARANRARSNKVQLKISGRRL